MMDTHNNPAFIAATATVRPYGVLKPRIAAGAIVMDGVRIIGDVLIGPAANIWYNCAIRGDVHSVRIGAETNIQDNTVLHVTHDRYPLSIGDRVTVGHAARLHGCTVEDESLVGIGAVVLDGAVVQQNAMVAAGAVVPPGYTVETGTLVAGVPARPIRALRPEEVEDLYHSAMRYVEYAQTHCAEMPGNPVGRPFRA